MSVSADGCCEVFRTKTIRARKVHTCCACGETIRKGDHYRYTFQVFEGELATDAHCLRCNAIIGAIFERQTDPDDTVDPELDCGHTWEEVFDGPPPDEVERLAFMSPDDAQSALAPKREGTG